MFRLDGLNHGTIVLPCDSHISFSTLAVHISQERLGARRSGLARCLPSSCTVPSLPAYPWRSQTRRRDVAVHMHEAGARHDALIGIGP